MAAYRDKERVDKAMFERDAALSKLYVAVMKHYDSCPPEVRACWDVADHNTREAWSTLREEIIVPVA